MSAREAILSQLNRAGITQAELARRMERELYWVNKRLKGHTTIDADELPLFARALGSHPCAFFPEFPLDDDDELRLARRLVSLLERRGEPA